MSDPLDNELLALVNKLTKIQKTIGGAKGKNDANGDHDGKMDRFLDLRDQMTERLMSLKDIFENIQRMEKNPGSNPRELISLQSQVRTELTALNVDWRELDLSYRNECKKRRSKISVEELSQRQQMLEALQEEIQRIKEIQRAGFVKGYLGKQIDKMEESEVFNPAFKGRSGDSKNDYVPMKNGVVGSRNLYMTEAHRTGLQQLKDRDAKIDAEIESIGKGVDELHEIARAANEEVRMQGSMLATLEGKIDDVHDHVSNVNVKLKETLEKARSSDKICLDIVCLLILVGMVIVVYELSRGKIST